jgi:signal transduction histidine kinase
MWTSDWFLFYYLPWGLFTLLAIIYIIDSFRQHRLRDQKSKESKLIKRLAERDKAFKATAELNSIVLDTLDFNLAGQRIANAIPQLLGYQTGVLALVDEKEGVLKRVAISETSGGVAALQFLEVPFSKITIKLSEKENFCIKALKQNKPMYTTKLYDVLRPVISLENSNKVQEMMGTQTTLVFPIYSKENKPYGTFLVSMNKKYEDITEYEHQTLKSFIDSVRIALDNASLFTSLQKATEQLKDANAKLKQLDVMKNEFVSVASHELRTPMTAIKSYLWMALEDKGGPLNEKQRYYVQRGYNSVDRLIRLVNDMLNISRIEAGRITIQLQEIDLEKLAQEVVDEVMPRAQEVGVSVAITKHEKLPNVLADPDKLKEVFFNLLGNSLKFTPKGGQVTVQFTLKDDLIETEITDTGAGIEADDIGKLFQKFGLIAGSYATNQPAMGTGLGLFICKSIIELHQGKIWADSEGRGKGATFTFQLKKFNKADSERFSKNISKKEPVGLIHSEI